MYYPPPLPPDEQIALCIRAKAGDRKARDRLVTTSMRFVVGRAHVFAKGHHRSGVEDLKLTRRLMRRFDGHHRFLVDYGWEHVARVVLGEKVRLGSEPYIMRAKKSKPVRPADHDATETRGAKDR